MAQVESHRMSVHVGDITRLAVDAIVNAANERLLPGGGACRAIGHCPTGSAVITPGFGLEARHVIHAVGPVWQGGGAGEDALLRACYTRALVLAAEAGVRDLAFPAISTGIFGYPLELATRVAIDAVAAFLAQHERPESVILCCFDQTAATIYRKVLASAVVG
jgi:O-acetyl-ADP-ribose deacetylase (regulator of RNase III)